MLIELCIELGGTRYSLRPWGGMPLLTSGETLEAGQEAGMALAKLLIQLFERTWTGHAAAEKETPDDPRQ